MSAGYWEPPAVGSEAETLLGSLERQRATFAWKCADLDASGLSRRLAPSELTLGRLLKHLAHMEDLSFTADLGGHPLPLPWAGVEVDDDPFTWAFTSADDDTPDDLYRLWEDAVGRSRAAVREVLADGDPATTHLSGTRPVTLRRLLVDMIEEYGRHTGQADLLREAVDGRAGEDPPGPATPYELR